MAAGVRRALPHVRSLDVSYGDVEVTVVNGECALVSATFRREMVIDHTTLQYQGGVSLLWRRIDDNWLIVHGHISHPLKVAK
jgi:ketosteroid isomerase-like protein